LILNYHDGSQSNASSFSGQDPAARSGWNFIGNSLTCDIDFQSFSRSNVAQAFYVFDPSLGGGTGGYRAHSPGGVGSAASSLIPPLTGFWIQSTGPGPSVGNGNALSASAHGRTTSRNFNNKGIQDRAVIQVSALNRPERTDDVVLNFDPTASWQFDPERDARELLHGSDLPNIACEHQGQYSTHKVIPFGPQAQTPVTVPAFFQGSSTSSSASPTTQSLFTFSLDPVWTTAGYGIYLQDRAMSTVHPLHSSAYVFADNGDIHRFSWILTPPGTTLSDASNSPSAATDVLTWKDGQGVFWIQSSAPLVQTPELLDLTGRSLGFLAPDDNPVYRYRWSTHGLSIKIGMYLIRVQTAAGEQTFKCL
jgi:hypothetical protein